VTESLSESPRTRWLFRATIFFVAVVVFAPSIGFEFSGWDEREVFVRNKRLLNPTLNSLRHYWFHEEFHLYVPVTQTAWWLTAQVARATNDAGETVLQPGYFRAANVLIHALAGLWCFELLRRLVRNPLMAMAGAVVYVAHPLQVESVCWAAATKDLLAGMFGLAALLAHNSQLPAKQRVALSTLLAAAAMLSKPSAVTLPAVALLIDVGLRGIALRRAIVPLLPWVSAAVPIIIIAKLVQPGHAGDSYTFFTRVSVTTYTIAFYLGKIVWPVNLAFDYGKTPALILKNASLAMNCAVVGATAVGCVALWKRFRACAMGLAIIFAAMTPVLGILPFDFQIYSAVGDHYMYLGMVGVAIIIAHLPRRMLGPVMMAAALCMTLSSMQISTWRTVETMARHNLKVNPQSWSSMNNLAPQLAARGELDEAMQLVTRARQMKDVEVTRNAFADVLVARAEAEAAAGNVEAAIATYRESLALNPKATVAWTNLAATLAENGRLAEALEAYQTAAMIDPKDAAAHAGLLAVRRAMAATQPAR
jgi:hypothetical protein